MDSLDFPANPQEKSGYVLEFHDEFDSDSLNLEKWIPYYLPHWSSREASKARYSFQDHALVLKIEADQAPWCPEFDGEVKVSSLQTGLSAGEHGSAIGQHPFNKNCRVREAQAKQITYTPQFGYFETRVKAVKSAKHMVALWMIGFEEKREESGEILIFEVFGNEIKEDSSEVRYGVHPFADPALKDEIYRERLPIDATNYHIYAVEWTPTHIDYFVDNVKRKTIPQSPNYPMQFMLNIYELPSAEEATGSYPKEFVIDYFRAYQPISGYKRI
jgi:hypothetical protein